MLKFPQLGRCSVSLQPEKRVKTRQLGRSPKQGWAVLENVTPISLRAAPQQAHLWGITLTTKYLNEIDHDVEV